MIYTKIESGMWYIYFNMWKRLENPIVSSFIVSFAVELCIITISSILEKYDICVTSESKNTREMRVMCARIDELEKKFNSNTITESQ